MSRRVEIKLYLDPEDLERIDAATAQFRGAGRRVSRNEVILQLVGDGFRQWSKDSQVVNRVEGTLGAVLDRIDGHERLLKSILLTLADGDMGAYRATVAAIDREIAAKRERRAAD